MSEHVKDNERSDVGESTSGPELSGQFDGPVAVNGGEAVDARDSKGMVYKPSGPVFVDSVIQFMDEKVFQHLGLEQRVGFVMLGVLILGVGIGLYFGLRPQHPTQMAGDFRIAVAGFAEKGQTGKSDLGMQLAEDVYLRLSENFSDVDLGVVVTVWGPSQVGMIGGRNRQERADAAAQLAEKINADIVIYGSVDTSEMWWEVAPEFYVAAHNFYQAEEIVGQYEIGHPFRVIGDQGPATRLEINNHLATRTGVLFRITMGLVHFQLQQYETALETFDTALMLTGAEDKGVRQVLYLWLGNAAGRMFDLDAAETYHQQAIELDPDYARPYVGLAGVYYLRALQPFQESLDPVDIYAMWLHTAIDTYRQALQAEHQPPLSDIETKVHFGLGQCYTMLVYSGNELYFDAAIAEFKAVIAAYNDGTNPRVRELAAEAHARLGLIYRLVGDSDRACEGYLTAASLLHDNPERQQLYIRQAKKITGCID